MRGRYMGNGSIAQRVRRVAALTVIVALLFAVPAYGATVSAESTATHSAPKVIEPPSKPSTRRPPASGSEIPVAPDPLTEQFRRELTGKQARLDEFMAQLDALDRELEVASEAYNAAIDRLREMKSRVTVAQGDLSQAQQAYAMQADILGQRASSMYRDGSLATIEILLDSKSVSDFMARVKFLNTIGIRDADIAASLQGQKDLLEGQVEELKNTQAVAESLEFELKARQIEIMLRIQERQNMVDEAQADIVDLLDSEAARRQSEESVLLAEILSGASKKGIVVEPGSPVETALAYHGVPYLWGGEKPSGFDCSGLMLYVFRQHGVNLPHYSGSQFRLGTKVAGSALAPGDAVFFGSPIHHVGMYIGGGYYIHAPRTGDFVKISKLADRSDFAGARRYAWTYRTAPVKGAVKSTSAALKSVKR